MLDDINSVLEVSAAIAAVATAFNTVLYALSVKSKREATVLFSLLLVSGGLFWLAPFLFNRYSPTSPVDAWISMIALGFVGLAYWVAVMLLMFKHNRRLFIKA